MTATATPTPPRTSGRDGFGQLLRAEWTKLWSVRRWALTLLGMAVLTVGFGLFAATSSRADVNEHPDFVVGPDGQPVTDSFHFVHRPLTGDGSVVARVRTQSNSHRWAGAGVMLKDGTRSGSSYAALMVTPGHGVRLGANFSTDVTGSPGTAPRWLKLTRSGTTVTGYESTDGNVWREVGRVTVPGLPPTAEVGLFVSSPPDVRVERQAGSTSVGWQSTTGSATFDNVRVDAAPPVPAVAWQNEDVGADVPAPVKPGRGGGGDGGEASEVGGVFTVTGSGEIGPKAPPDDVVQISLFGAQLGLMAVVAVGVLFMTAEYKRRMIWTTFAASPRRVGVLAAKAVVIGTATFGLGLIACVTAFLVAQPILREHGFAPPAFPPPSLSDGPVLRAVIGTAVFLALLAAFSLGVGAILRHSAGAITMVIVVVLLPAIVGSVLPIAAARWLMRLTPAGGFAVQRAKPPTDTLVEPWSMIGPWTGLAVVSAYAAGALLIAGWLLRRRDA